jgi:hypothetical protein
VKDGWVRQASRTGCSVVLGGNDSRDNRAERAVGVGMPVGGVGMVRFAADRTCDVDIVRSVGARCRVARAIRLAKAGASRDRKVIGTLMFKKTMLNVRISLVRSPLLRYGRCL